MADVLIALLTFVQCDEPPFEAITKELDEIPSMKDLVSLVICASSTEDALGWSKTTLAMLLAHAFLDGGPSGIAYCPLLLPVSLLGLVVLLPNMVVGKASKGDSRSFVVEVQDFNLRVLLRIEDGQDPSGHRIEWHPLRFDGAVVAGNTANASVGATVAAADNALGFAILPLGCVGGTVRLVLRCWSTCFARLPSLGCLLRGALALLVLLPLGQHLVDLVIWDELGDHRPRQGRVHPVSGILERLDQAVDAVEVLCVLAVFLGRLDAELAQRAFGAGQAGGARVGSVGASGLVARIVV